MSAICTITATKILQQKHPTSTIETNNLSPLPHHDCPLFPITQTHTQHNHLWRIREKLDFLSIFFYHFQLFNLAPFKRRKKDTVLISSWFVFFSMPFSHPWQAPTLHTAAAPAPPFSFLYPHFFFIIPFCLFFISCFFQFNLLSVNNTDINIMLALFIFAWMSSLPYLLHEEAIMEL